jgi:hypothetical protein
LLREDARADVFRDEGLLAFPLDFLALAPDRLELFDPPRLLPPDGRAVGGEAFGARCLTFVAARTALERDAKLSPDDAMVRPFDPVSFQRHFLPLSS